MEIYGKRVNWFGTITKVYLKVLLVAAFYGYFFLNLCCFSLDSIYLVKYTPINKKNQVISYSPWF